MAAYRRVYDSRHLQAGCQELGSIGDFVTNFLLSLTVKEF